MHSKLLLNFFIWVILTTVQAGVATKLGFEGDSGTSLSGNSSQSTDEDVEVKHTIILSTKLRNNNRRGIHISDNEGSGVIVKSGRSHRKEDSGDVPVVNGYKALETTLIRSQPKQPEIYPQSLSINRNIGDDYDMYSSAPSNQWRPASFYNNINYQSPDADRIVTYNLDSRRQAGQRTPGKFQRRITDDGLKDYYCSKCRELSKGSGCNQPSKSPWNYESTTKIKVDGKIAKLN